VHPKWSGLCPESPKARWRAYSAPPDPLTCCPLSKNLFPAFVLLPWISWFPPRQISGYADGFREQSKQLWRVPLQRNCWSTVTKSNINTDRPSIGCCPLFKNLFPTLGLWPRISWFPLDKFLAMPVHSCSTRSLQKKCVQVCTLFKENKVRWKVHLLSILSVHIIKCATVRAFLPKIKCVLHVWNNYGSVSNQNSCKGFHFKEKVEKHWSTDSDEVKHEDSPSSSRPPSTL